jgi:hypothetical protein
VALVAWHWLVKETRSNNPAIIQQLMRAAVQ